MGTLDSHPQLIKLTSCLPRVYGVSFICGGSRSTRKNRRPVASHWQTLSHYVVSHTRILNTKITELFSIRLWNLLHVHVLYFSFVKSSSHKLIYSQINIMYIGLIVIVHETLIYTSFISNNAFTIRFIWCPISATL
jgi:hypothetical protein